MQIGLFGGSFNPPHLAHLLLSTYVLEATALDEVWWVPTWAHAFAKELLPFEQRVRMVEVLLQPYPNMRVDRVEERLGGVSYMFETLSALRDAHRDVDFHLLVGADVLEELPRWHRSDELLEMVDLIAVGRPGCLIPKGLAPRVQLLPIELPDISSTHVRELLGRGQSTTGLVAHSVARHIEQKQLYRAANQARGQIDAQGQVISRPKEDEAPA